jgi:hypothetical protein
VEMGRAMHQSTCYSFARHAAVEFSSSVPRKNGKMVFCAQKVLVKTKKVVYTAPQRPGIPPSTGSNRVCLANAILEWPLKPIEAQRCVKRLGSSGEIETDTRTTVALLFEHGGLSLSWKLSRKPQPRRSYVRWACRA